MLVSSDATLHAANYLICTQWQLGYSLMSSTLMGLGPFLRPFSDKFIPQVDVPSSRTPSWSRKNSSRDARWGSDLSGSSISRKWSNTFSVGRKSFASGGNNAPDRGNSTQSLSHIGILPSLPSIEMPRHDYDPSLRRPTTATHGIIRQDDWDPSARRLTIAIGQQSFLEDIQEPIVSGEESFQENTELPSTSCHGTAQEGTAWPTKSHQRTTQGNENQPTTVVHTITTPHRIFMDFEIRGSTHRLASIPETDMI